MILIHLTYDVLCIALQSMGAHGRYAHAVVEYILSLWQAIHLAVQAKQ